MRARCGVAARLAVPFEALAAALVLDALDLAKPAAAAAAVAVLAVAYALLPPPATLPTQPPLAPPLVTGGVPVLGHLLEFIKGPVGMIDALRSRPAGRGDAGAA